LRAPPAGDKSRRQRPDQREAVFSILLLIIIVIVVLALLGFFGARGRSV
jgi:hypothetical protein